MRTISAEISQEANRGSLSDQQKAAMGRCLRNIENFDSVLANSTVPIGQQSQAIETFFEIIQEFPSRLRNASSQQISAIFNNVANNQITIGDFDEVFTKLKDLCRDIYEDQTDKILYRPCSQLIIRNETSMSIDLFISLKLKDDERAISTKARYDPFYGLFGGGAQSQQLNQLKTQMTIMKNTLNLMEKELK